MPLSPLCFVLMPFDQKDDPQRPGKKIDFEALYFGAIEPAIEDAKLEPVRPKDDPTLGIIREAMFERLLLCDFAIADVTIPNLNVFHGLGARHASRVGTTLSIFADHTRPAVDGGLPYKLGPNNEIGSAQTAALREALGQRLGELRRIKPADGALYQLLGRYGGHDKTDIFRDVVAYSEKRKTDLAAARARRPRSEALVELGRIRDDLRPFDDVEVAVIVDLYLSYRALDAHGEMLALFDEMPRSLRRSVLVREQRAFALNRLAGKSPADRPLRVEAIQLLQQVLAEVGPNPETMSLLGRIHKDRWQEAVDAGNDAEARGHLSKAADTYRAGFEADCRDAFPGINAVTLLDIQGDRESLGAKDQILPVVKFAVARRVAGGSPDYWDLATLLQIAILDNDTSKARKYASQALAAVREDWEPATSARNLTYILNARRARGDEVGWLEEIIKDLEARAGERP
jgi:hypothetical protein